MVDDVGQKLRWASIPIWCKIFKKFNTKLGSLWAVRLKRFLNGSRLQKVCVGHKKLNLEGTQWHFVVQNFKLDEEKKER